MLCYLVSFLSGIDGCRGEIDDYLGLIAYRELLLKSKNTQSVVTK